MRLELGCALLVIAVVSIATSALVQTVNNMYQNVSGKSIENQELILRVFLL